MHARTAIIALSIVAGTCSAQTVLTGASTDAEGLQKVVDDYRTLLGDLNAPEPGSLCQGRRQIDWDAAPDQVSAPNEFPGDFFNADVFPRARGVEFETPGEGFQLSATIESGVGVEFANIDPSFDDLFSVFSPQRLFTPIGSTVVDVYFFVPGTDVPATSRGFGAVFSDVDVEGSTTLEFYAVGGEYLGSWSAPTGPASEESLSFVGVAYDEPIVEKVRITSGNTALAWGEVESYPDVDLVVVDDFIFGEPVSQCPADCDANGQLNILDFVCFKGLYDVSSACADVNGDGALNIYDFITFQTEFQAGCDY